MVGFLCGPEEGSVSLDKLAEGLGSLLCTWHPFWVAFVCLHVCDPGDGVAHSIVTHRCVNPVVRYARAQHNPLFPFRFIFS